MAPENSGKNNLAAKAASSQLVFFGTILTNMKNKPEVDWDLVAAKTNYKSGAIARIRFNTIIRNINNTKRDAAPPKSSQPRLPPKNSLPDDSPPQMFKPRKRLPSSPTSSAPRSSPTESSPTESSSAKSPLVNSSPAKVSPARSPKSKAQPPSEEYNQKFVSPYKIIKTKPSGRKLTPKKLKQEAERVLFEDATLPKGNLVAKEEPEEDIVFKVELMDEDD
ncbi:uncharacterized protein LY89DRAFT_724595 [Mollisia scopiformis]|uniref:Myb-like DNA-binding domain-containing protein n=1 Tax=Mollisia scopiformis TaxID=149040 RepID=A0A132B9L4_MOLSC|nr:uncharacterized protein LY89DRAFT_724595 [Mollisia scopiformis]KUJ09061.1 hypothetical protein LY89DRAFT_724595 [Mollisia scopiformis]